MAMAISTCGSRNTILPIFKVTCLVLSTMPMMGLHRDCSSTMEPGISSMAPRRPGWHCIGAFEAVRSPI